MSNLETHLDLISIIIPVFNSEGHLPECLGTALEQTYENIEILCVDDCSTDGSKLLIHGFSEKDNRVRYFRTIENSGAGPARNLAIAQAKGKYIFFLDSDDRLFSKNSLQLMVTALEENKADACGGNICAFSGDKKIFYNGIRFEENRIGTYHDYPSTHNYTRFLFKKEIIDSNGIRFPNFRRRQDPVFFLNYMIHTKQIAFITGYIYAYRKNHKSFKISDQAFEHSIKAFLINFSVLQKNGYLKHMKAEYSMYISLLSIIDSFEKIRLYRKYRSQVRDCLRGSIRTSFSPIALSFYKRFRRFIHRFLGASIPEKYLKKIYSLIRNTP